MKHFVLEQINTHSQEAWKHTGKWLHAGKWLHSYSIGKAKKTDSK